MKATSKAEKRRRQIVSRGRKCKPDVARTDSGRISRAANSNAEAPDKLAKEVRARMHGLTVDQAKDPLSATVIGRMLINREISQKQWDALDRFDKLADRYMTVIQAPDSLRVRSGFRPALTEEDEAESDASIRRKWADVMKDIQDAQNVHQGNLMAALQYMVCRNEMHAHLVGDLRIASNVLARHYGLTS